MTGYQKGNERGRGRRVKRVCRFGTRDDAYPQHNLGSVRRRLGHFDPFLHSPRVIPSSHHSIVTLSPLLRPRGLSSPHPTLRIRSRHKVPSTVSLSFGRSPIGILYSCCLASSSYQVTMVTQAPPKSPSSVPRIRHDLRCNQRHTYLGCA